MIDLDLFRTFLAVYRTGSVTAAATQLNITQPAASNRLKALESGLRRTLFTRDSRSLRPTPAAHDLARSLAPHLDGLEAVAATARVQAGELEGTVHIGGPGEGLAARILPALAHLPALGIRLRVTLGQTPDLIAQLAAGDLDLVVATLRIPGPAIDYAPLFHETFVLVGAPRWVGSAVTAGGVDGAPLLAYAEDLPIIRRYWRDVFGTEPAVQAAMVVGDLRALIEAAAAGAGVTVAPAYLCAEAIAAGRLVVLHRPVATPGNDIFLAWNRFALRQPRNVMVRDRLIQAATGWR